MTSPSPGILHVIAFASVDYAWQLFTVEESPMAIAMLFTKMAAVIVTMCTCSVLVWLIDYSLDRVIFRLAAVEAPVTEVKDVGLDQSDQLLKAENRVVMVQEKPRYLTSSIRGTLHYLQAEAGDFSALRGLGVDLTIAALRQPVVEILYWLINTTITAKYHIPGVITGIVCDSLTAQADAAWTHTVISKPRHKFWFRRLTGTWFSILKITFIAILVQQIACEAVEWAMSLSPWCNECASGPQGPLVAYIGYEPAVPVTLTIFVKVMVKVYLRAQIQPSIELLVTGPTDAIKTRIQASIMPDDEDAIVPMDREFKGRPQSGGILYQSEQKPLSFMQALKTVDRKTFVRMLTLDVKIHMIKTCRDVFFWALTFAAIVWLLGPESFQILLKMVGGLPIVHDDLRSILGTPSWSVLHGIVRAYAQPDQHSDGQSKLDMDLMKDEGEMLDFTRSLGKKDL